MGLDLSAEDVDALETRTEGWIAGLQLAALSMQGRADTSSFIKSFTGSHHFVLDYLVEEVLGQLPENVQTFLLRTSILDRLCGPLCDAILGSPEVSGQETLLYLEHANLFVVPLDDERRWYRYHHLFADLLRQRLLQSATPASASLGEKEGDIVAGLHIRASQWYEDNGLEIEAFQHAAAANDIERAERLIEGKGMPLHYRGAMAPVLHWLGSLPTPVMDARPSLWVTYASATMISGHPSAVEPKLQAAEAALSAQNPAGCRAGRQDPRPYGSNCRHPGPGGCQSEPGRNHYCPITPRSGVSAARQPACPHDRYLSARVCLPAPGRPRSRPFRLIATS